ncbi:MAG: L,D-transpeptidase family protein [Croceibacterium sp.]
MRIATTVVSILALSACGMNGTDRNKDQTTSQAAAPAQDNSAEMASQDPANGQMAQADIPDPDPRPLMQMQVVLDRQGFGPGVIDGKEGISTANALKGFQEAHEIQVSGKSDDATKQLLAQWNNIPATRVVRIPDSWGQADYHKVPDGAAAQAKETTLGYESLDERLAERFHTTIDVLKQLNPNGQPAGATATNANPMPSGTPTPMATPSPTASATMMAEASPASTFRAGQLVRVPNIGADRIASGTVDDPKWQQTLVSLGVGTEQPKVARVVVDKSEGWLKGYDEAGKLVTMFTVTSGSSHDPLPLGDWKITGVSKNPPFHYNPDLFWDAKATDQAATLPPGPNGPVGVVWIDLTKEHYGIHGTSAPESIGRAQSHGCVRLTNWDAARLAGMVSSSTKVLFQA